MVLLALAEPGQNYVVGSVYERDPRLLEFLEGRGVRPGARIRLLGRNYDQTLAIATERGEVPLGGAAAERIWVSPAAASARKH
jgi:DtxR family Mn-dependent transcriptional regulator